ncbi:MAG: NAD(P)/FAD-dependent oxidoreductase [Gemmatimonadota bacterium]|jgi:flavin-dependent dehydrogenase
MRYEVIIVGAGPSGLSTALFLLRARPELRGRILVLERREFPREKICAGAIGARADRLLGEVGIRVDVPSVPVAGARVTVPKGSAERSPGGIGRVVRRFEFDARLAELTRERGIRIIEGAPVKEIEMEEDGVMAVAGGQAFRSRVLVGADGVGSFVRRWLGLPFGQLRARVVEVDTERLAGDPPPDVLHFDVSNRDIAGYAWDFPTPLDGEVRMSRGVYALELGDGEPPDVQALLEARLGEMGLDPTGLHMKKMVERGFQPHHPFSSRRVILVGEAAGVDPFTGEGIAEAVQYGALAGPYLGRKLAVEDLTFGDWKTHFLRSSVGLDLFLRRWTAFLCFRLARKPVESLFVKFPRVLDFTTGLFAGRSPFQALLPAWSTRGDSRSIH